MRRSRINVHFTSKKVKTLLHAEEAKSFLHQRSIGVESAAAVRNQQANGRASSRQHYARGFGFAVLDAVAQSFLRNAEQTQSRIAIERERKSGLMKLDIQFSTLAQFGAKTLDGS